MSKEKVLAKSHTLMDVSAIGVRRVASEPIYDSSLEGINSSDEFFKFQHKTSSFLHFEKERKDLDTEESNEMVIKRAQFLLGKPYSPYFNSVFEAALEFEEKNQSYGSTETMIELADSDEESFILDESPPKPKISPPKKVLPRCSSQGEKSRQGSVKTLARATSSVVKLSTLFDMNRSFAVDTSREDSKQSFNGNAIYYSPVGCAPENAELSYSRLNNGEKIILAGTVDGLIDCLSSVQRLGNGQEYKEVLILTHPHFTTSIHFLSQLLKKFNDPALEAKDAREEEKQLNRAFQLRIINTIRKWVEMIPDDFENPLLMQTLFQFVENLKQSGDPVKTKCAFMLEKSWHKVTIGAIPRMMEKSASKKKAKTFTGFSIDTLASQMTLFDFDLFKKIPPSELLRKRWFNGAASKAFSDRMETVTYWVATEIIKASGLKGRVTMISAFLKLSEALLEQRNFFSLTSIYLGLSLLAIERLTKTWRSLPTKHNVLWDRIKELMEPIKNFKNFRHAWSFADLPKIPPPTLFQKDLLFIEDGNPDKNEYGLINFDKLAMLGKCLNSIRTAQQTPYDGIALDRNAQDFLREIKHIPLEEINEISKQLEVSTPKTAFGIRRSMSMPSSPTAPTSPNPRVTMRI